MRAFSLDLREWVLAAYDAREGRSRQLAKRFGVSDPWIRKLIQQRQATGSIAPKEYQRGPKRTTASWRITDMGREITARRAPSAAFFAIILTVFARGAFAELPAISNPNAIDRYRAAAALQNRELFDLAAADWAAFASDHPADPLTASARYQRGVCLAQLKRYDEAQQEFSQLLASGLKIEPQLEEQCRTQAGLARYNVAIAKDRGARSAGLREAIAEFDQQLKQFPNGPLAPQAAFYRCEALYASERVKTAAKAYRALLEKYPNHPQRAEAMYGLGVAQQEAEQFQDAGAALADFVAKYPEHALATDARVRQAESLLAAGEHFLAVGQAEEAIGVLSVAAALPRWSRSDEVLLALADAYRIADRPEVAIETCDKLIAEFPDADLLDRAFFCRAESRSTMENWSAAADDFQSVVERWPQSSVVRQTLLACARIQFRGADAAAAEASLDRLIEDHADSELLFEARILRATVRHERGNYSGGVADADTVLKASTSRPMRSDALYIRGLCQLGLRQPAEAAETFERIVAKDPQYRAMDRVLYDLAWAQQESHDTETATATFARLAESHPESPLAAEGWYRIGEVRYAAGEYEAAAARFEATLTRAKEPAVRERAAHKLAWCRFEQQKFAAAQTAFASQLEAHPQGALAPDARLMCAECQFRQSEYQAALALYTEAIDEIEATDALRQSATLHAAQAAANLQQWQRCLELAERAIKAYPQAAWIDEARIERGTALFYLNRVDEAEAEAAALAVSRDVTAARAEYMLAKIQAARGKTDEAIRTYFKVAYGYGDENASEPYRRWQAESLFDAARCLEETDRVDSARKLYEELLARHPASAKAPDARAALQQILRR